MKIVALRDTNLGNLKNLNRLIYRNKEERRENPREDKSTWFRNGGDTATIMVPTTPGSR